MTVDPPASRPEASVDAEAFKGSRRWDGNSRAPTYDSFIGRLTSQLVDPLLDAAGVGPEMRVLDLATGPGYAAARAAERGAAVVGGYRTLDGPARQQLHPTLEFREADAEALPFQDSSFDAAVSYGTGRHPVRARRSSGSPTTSNSSLSCQPTG